MTQERSPQRCETDPTANQEMQQSTMALKIGVMGGATGIISRDHMDKAHELGRAIARNECILITGACPGLPLAAACGATQEYGTVIGISPGLSLHEHIYKYNSPTQFHDVLIYTGSGLMGREVVNIRSSDIVIIIGGRSGTLDELAIAYDEGKLIGVLTGTGGISDMVKDILAACEKDTGSKVVYQSDPERLIKEVLQVYREGHFRRPSCFCIDRPPGIESSTMVGMERDPVCGMQLYPQSAAAQRTRDHWQFFFCSSACAEKFDAAPSHYLPEKQTNE